MGSVTKASTCSADAPGKNVTTRGKRLVIRGSSILGIADNTENPARMIVMIDSTSRCLFSKKRSAKRAAGYR
jgi:hypothetical protein